jgi:hypothetical protein
LRQIEQNSIAEEDDPTILAAVRDHKCGVGWLWQYFRRSNKRELYHTLEVIKNGN